MIDTDVSRRKFNNIKWSDTDQDLLPMTIADMDIATPDFIREALNQLLSEKVLGYSLPEPAFYESIIQWQRQRHSVELTRDQLILLPSVVTGISLSLRTLTQPNDAVLVMAPYYPKYRNLIQNTDRQLVAFPLVQKEGQYVINFERLEKIIASKKVKAMIICNPHNPGGRVWTNAELQQLHELAREYNVLIIADEIHDDTIFSDNYPVSMLSNLMGAESDAHTILITAATKAFNLAGTKLAYLAVKNPSLLAQLQQAAEAEGIQEVNTFGVVATQTAYQQGERWLTEVNQYLEANRDDAYDYLRENVPLIKPMLPQASYLMWLDFAAYGLTDEALDETLRRDAHLALNPGIDYGQSGGGFMRLNFAVDKEVLKTALHRLKQFDQTIKASK